MSGGADNVQDGTVHGTSLPRWSSSQPYFVESISGGDAILLTSILSLEDCIPMCTFSLNASLVSGMEHTFTDDEPLFPVFERHILNLHYVMELYDSATLPHAAHVNFVA